MSDVVLKKSNEIIDPQAQMIENFLVDVGLPANNVIASMKERKVIGNNIRDLVDELPEEIKKDARYLSKFVVGAGFGLFDYSLNAIWNEVVINLRQKVVMYGLEIFYDTAVGGSTNREFYKTEEHLASIKDSVLLDTCKKLELISDITYKKLKHILDMRNNIGISHPTDYNINAHELMGWLDTCITEVLNNQPSQASIQLQSFINNLKNKTEVLENTEIEAFSQKSSELPTHLCGSLLRTLFGIYVSSTTPAIVKKNISLIANSLWDRCNDDIKYRLGIALESYNINLHRDKYILGEEFFNLVNGNKYKSSSHKTIKVNELITELRDKHNGWDNFHHEAPIAALLYSYNPEKSDVLDSYAHRFYKTITMCRIGNGVLYNNGVSPSAKEYYDNIISYAGDKFAPIIIASFFDFEIKNKLFNEVCRTNAKKLLEILRKTMVNERLIECVDYLISNIEKDSKCIFDTEFKKLAIDYIDFK